MKEYEINTVGIILFCLYPIDLKRNRAVKSEKILTEPNNKGR